MTQVNKSSRAMASRPALSPARPLWQLAPTRTKDGRCMADFMMLIPGLADRPTLCREQVESGIREVCESYGELVTFADVNYSINVLWVSVAAQPGLGGRVARSIRERVPDALLIGGQLAAGGTLQTAESRRAGWRCRLRGLSRRMNRLLGGPDC
jgi:hypothetical protein